MKTTTIKPSDVANIIGSIPKGAIFTVEFVNKNGDLRVMNCRKGVTAGLKENARPKAANPANIVTVYDMKIAQTETDASKAYRCINVNTVRTIKAEKQVFEVK